jgi:crotonobetainyl-CoA:carnitine CoA-transferase CaiB-like acyl-CoA transferase
MRTPSFGCLQGLKVLSSGVVVAGPLAPTLFAENGADVIHVESALSKDILRQLGPAWVQEHRNQRVVALNVAADEGREAFLRMLKWCDIWVESSKPGTYDKWGLTDEQVWKVNPRLVIVHVSGFGQSGEPSYVSRPSYDAVGTTFSGYASLNGPPEMPYIGRPWLCDYLTGFQVAWSALAAYIRAMKSGVGESVDVAQYEVMTRIQAGWSTDGLTEGKPFERFSSADRNGAGDPFYRCRNGRFVLITMAGAGPMRRGLPLIGLGDDPELRDLSIVLNGKPYTQRFVQALRDYCSARTDLEVERELMDAGVPVCRVYEYPDILQDPHMKARGNVIEVHDPVRDRKVKTFAPSPKFVRNPQQVWCSGRAYGADNEEVLKELGYADADIAGMYARKVLAKDP